MDRMRRTKSYEHFSIFKRFESVVPKLLSGTLSYGEACMVLELPMIEHCQS